MIPLTTGSWWAILFITIMRRESLKLTSGYSERVRLLVAWSQERESYMSILMVWITVLCGLDYQHTNHSGAGLMFMDVLKKFNWYLVSDSRTSSIPSSSCVHTFSVLSLLLLSPKVFLFITLSLSSTRPQEPLPQQNVLRRRTSSSTPPHQTSSGTTAKIRTTVLHQQITNLQQDNDRLKRKGY